MAVRALLCDEIARAQLDDAHDDGSGGPDWSRTSGTRFRKPLLYPSELRGHGRATLVHPFDLREQPLALSKLPARVVATELATVSASLAATPCPHRGSKGVD